jgi:hypothetical protein
MKDPKSSMKLVSFSHQVLISQPNTALAVVWAVIHFRPYLYGTDFILYTDHQPIKWLMTNDKLTGKLVRWAFIL